MRKNMDYQAEYQRWCEKVKEKDLLDELMNMDESGIEDAFYRSLSFGTGGLRGMIGAGTNRMNIHVVGKASQGLSKYLLDKHDNPSVVIGYDSRIKSDVFARVAAGVFAANGIMVWFWPELNPVPTVSFAISECGASAGVMITASHNPCEYNGYKVYGHDGCQITIDAADEIFSRISKIDIFEDVKRVDFDEAVRMKMVRYIPDSIMDRYINAVKSQSTLYGDEIKRDAAIVYSPLNGTGLRPVLRVLRECGFKNITVVEEQRNPDGNFPSCPYPNPEIGEAMELGLEYCRKINADLLLATDPDADRCGIAVKTLNGDYYLMSGNEVGLLLLDYICSQKTKHRKMPTAPIFIKTIVTTDLAERIANHYGVETVNVLTGFKYIGEYIGKLELQGKENNYIFGFEESYGYLTGTYVRDKDAVNAAMMICEMFAFYQTRGVTLMQKLEELYATYGYCLNSLHSYSFPGLSGKEKMNEIMANLRSGLDEIGGIKIERTEDYRAGLNGLPKADVIKYTTSTASAVVRPSGTEPKLKLYLSITAETPSKAKTIEKLICSEFEERIR